SSTPQPRGREVGPGGGTTRRAPPQRAARRGAAAAGALLPRPVRGGVRGDAGAVRERSQDRPPDGCRDPPPAGKARGGRWSGGDRRTGGLGPGGRPRARVRPDRAGERATARIANGLL